MKRIAFVLIVLFGLTGCQLSTTPGVSVVPVFKGAMGTGGGEFTGHSVADLARESVRYTDFPRGECDEKFYRGHFLSYLNDDNRYDVVVSGEPETWGDQLTTMLRDTFGVQAVRDTREIDVLILTKRAGMEPTLALADAMAEPRVYTWPTMVCGFALLVDLPLDDPTSHTFMSSDMGDLARMLSYEAGIIVVDETGVVGRYDFEIIADSKQDHTFEASLELLGLKLVPATRLVAAVFIETTDEKVPHPARTSDTYTIVR